MRLVALENALATKYLKTREMAIIHMHIRVVNLPDASFFLSLLHFQIRKGRQLLLIYV
jgi:hypothetical protein